jgi:hypothetical protein
MGISAKLFHRLCSPIAGHGVCHNLNKKGMDEKIVLTKLHTEVVNTKLYPEI